MKLVLAESALSDLSEIGEWIARDNPDRAVSFVRELRLKCFDIADRPLAYPVASEIGPDIRKCRHHRYLILYRAAHDRIEVVHVVHGARDYARLFEQL